MKQLINEIKRMQQLAGVVKENKDLNKTPLDDTKQLSKEDEFLINGSGLFFFKTKLDDETQLKIVKWYNNLSSEDKKYVDILRNEASDESYYFSQD